MNSSTYILVDHGHYQFMNLGEDILFGFSHKIKIFLGQPQTKRRLSMEPRNLESNIVCVHMCV